MSTGTLPVVERITQNILQTLRGVNPSNGYPVTLDAERATRLGQRTRANLCVLKQDIAVEAQAPHRHLRWWQNYVAVAYVTNSESSTVADEQRINTVRAAIEKALRQDITRGALAINTTLSPPQNAAPVDGEFTGITVRFAVLYQTLQDDPFSD